MTGWRDRMVGARMAVDDEFSPEVDGSSFTRQEWGLVMTAVEFDVHRADDPAAAELYADTDRLPEIMPEVERVAEMQSMGGAPRDESGGGLLDSVRSALGLSGGGADGVDQDRVREAERLVDGYATALQAHLEETGSWADVLAAYREEDASTEE